MTVFVSRVVLVFIVLCLDLMVRLCWMTAAYVNGQALGLDTPLVPGFGRQEKRINCQRAQPFLDGFQRNPQVMERTQQHIPACAPDAVDA